MKITKPLFTFEMANNHMGDVEHGILIVREFGKLIKEFPEFNFSMKLQYRDNKFFHPEHINRTDHKLIKRFTETRLSDEDFKRIIDEIHKCGFISMCTPWDNDAVDYQIKMGVEVIKIASCAFTDWDLLEKIAQTDKEIVASTAGATEEDIKNVYNFLRNRGKIFSILHCVGEYPCIKENLDLNQIDYLKNNYGGINIGYSTHEDPNNFDSIKIAVAKGAVIFEKHVGVKTSKYELNLYSANPEQAKKWLESARDAYTMCGNNSSLRKQFSAKEIEDLRILHRGAYAISRIEIGESIRGKYFLAMPNVAEQVVANELGKYNEYTAKEVIEPGKPIMLGNIKHINHKSKITKAHNGLKSVLEKSSILLPKNIHLEISHHYGIEKFEEIGAGLIHLINREYSKIIVVMLPNQNYPEHKHTIKNETYYVIFGKLEVKCGDATIVLHPGQTYSVEKGVNHSFKALEEGVVFEEIATTYIKGDSAYVDEKINKLVSRKTVVLL